MCKRNEGNHLGRRCVDLLRLAAGGLPLFSRLAWLASGRKRSVGGFVSRFKLSGSARLGCGSCNSLSDLYSHPVTPSRDCRHQDKQFRNVASANLRRLAGT